MPSFAILFSAVLVFMVWTDRFTHTHIHRQNHIGGAMLYSRNGSCMSNKIVYLAKFSIYTQVVLTFLSITRDMMPHWIKKTAIYLHHSAAVHCIPVHPLVTCEVLLYCSHYRHGLHISCTFYNSA